MTAPPPALRKTLLRFEDDAVERSFLAWSAQKTVPFIRWGMVAAAATYAFSLAMGLFIRPDEWLQPAVVSALTVIPLSVIGAALSWRPAAVPWLHTYATVTNLLCGLHAIYIGQHVAGLHGVGLAQVMVVAFYGTTVLRLRPIPAALAVGTYVAAEEVWIATSMPGPVEVVQFTMIMPVGVYMVCLFASVVLDRVARESFEQERIIAEQRTTIEGLLRQEISHQVAERSKSLGEQLAKVEVALPVVRLEPGNVFAERYSILRRLGSGGMGAVFEVERITDRQRLALKVVTDPVSGAQAARFAREAEIGARLRHPNLVPIVDVGVSAAGAPYLVMELITGGGLEDARSRFGQEKWALAVLRQIAAGVAALHEAGVVHRDLKPANILLSGADDAPLARISDFGISRFGETGGDVDPLGETAVPQQGLKGPSLTRPGAIIGTPLYMAPEAAKGARAVGAPADVFAFGIIAFELLTGRQPFPTPVVMELIEGRPAPKPAALEGPYGSLILSCLAELPAERPTVQAVRAALDRASQAA